MSIASRRHSVTAGIVALAVVVVSVATLLAARARTGHATGGGALGPSTKAPASFVPYLARKRPLFVLALGSDARSGEPVDRERADSIHIIGVDLKAGRASILGFPRDSYVDIPGHGKWRINKALELGGPQLVVKTVEKLTRIPIDYWLLTSFPGLVRMVDGIGGLHVDVPTEMHDPLSGADFSPGPQHLDGREALAFARDRHDLPNGDFDRSLNQGRLLLSALAKLRNSFDEDPAAVFAWMAAAWPRVQTNMGVGALLDLALTATHIPVGNVNNGVVPGEPGMAGSASVVHLSPSAPHLYDDLRTDGFVDFPTTPAEP